VSGSPNWQQDWAELRCGAEVARIEGDASRLVAWPFTPLREGERREVSVRAASTANEVTDWSEPLDVRAGFVDHWHGEPIALANPETVARPARFRTSIQLDKPVRQALLYSTALGAAEFRVNGSPVDDSVLGPGWTSYDLRTLHDTNDITPHLVRGENVIAAQLGGFWYTEEYHVLTPPKRHFGEQPAIAAQLVVHYVDGTVEHFATGPGWRAIADPEVRASGFYTGEHVDASGAIPGWDAPGFDDRDWPAAVAAPVDLPRPSARIAAPARRTDTRPVHEVRRVGDRLLRDFGQNLVGRLCLRVTGPAGTRIVARHAEVLDGDELAVRPLRRATQTDEFVLAGSVTEEFEPKFTVHGFRYVELTGWPGEFDPNDVVAVIIGSDLRRTGWFDCSDASVNRLHENIVWTTRGNYLGVPMDCPQRDERLGWTGDTQLFAPTAAFLYDTEAFLLSWLRDLRLEQQRAEGVVPLFAPTVVPDFATRGPVAAWGDAIAIIPEVLAHATGDLALLDEFAPAVFDWVERVQEELDDLGLWTTGRQLGDWLDPLAPANAPARGRTDTDLVATAYAVRTLRIAGDLAERTGDAERAERYRMLAERSRAAFESSFVTPGGRMMNDTQTAYAIALRFALIADPDTRARAAARLAEVVRRDGFHIATGIVGTSMIAPALTESGSHAEAERLFFQPESPSWLFPVRVGATTIWERWDGLQEDGTLNPGGMISFNHVALGAVGQWLHEQVAGLTAAEPGYKRLRIRPYPLAGLDHASVRLETPYGEAVSGWRRDGAGTLIVHTRVPANTTAEIVLPDGAEHRVGSGDHEWRVELAAPAAPVPVTLDSSMADLADNPAAYAAFYRALDASPNRFVAGSVRRNALYREGLRIRDALVFVDASTLASIETALAEAIA
jgi:alpha-L-rhamnosidase